MVLYDARKKFPKALKDSGLFDRKEELPPIVAASKPVVAIEKAIRDELISR